MANLIEEYPVPLLFKRILADKLSGELTIAAGEGQKRLYFTKGELEFASSNLDRERLGEILCSQGKITRQQLIMFREIKEKTRAKLGGLLVRQMVLTKKELFDTLLDQVKIIANSCFALDSGEWDFREGTPKIPRDQKFGIPVEEIITEGAGKIPGFSYYKKKFNLRSPVTIPIPESLGQLLTPEDIRFYVKLTQCTSIVTRQILSIVEMPEKDFWQRLILMFLLNIVDFIEFRIDRKLHQHLEMIRELHGKLKSDSIDYYQLLELKDTASVNDVRGKYFLFSKKYNPGSIDAPPDSRAEEEAGYIIEKGAQAFETLSDQKKKDAYDTGKYKREEIRKKQEKKQSDPRKAGQLYLKAHGFYEENRYYQASRLMEEAVRLDGSRASYFMLLGLCQMRIPDCRPAAEKNLQKAAEMEPWNADPVFYLGELYRSERLVKKAEKCYRKALEINMEHTLATKMVTRIEKRLKKKSLFSFGKK